MAAGSSSNSGLWTAIASGVGVVASGAVAVIVTRRQVRSAERVAALQREHELKLAREEREQTRRLNAYQVIFGWMNACTRDIEWFCDGDIENATRPGFEPGNLKLIDAASLVISKNVEVRTKQFADSELKFYAFLGEHLENADHQEMFTWITANRTKIRGKHSAPRSRVG